MIATGQPQQYVPCGRKHYEQHHPGENVLWQASNIGHAYNSAGNLNIIKALDNVSLEDNRNQKDKWCMRFVESYEEELYVNNHTVVWSRGSCGETKQVIKSYTIDCPVLQALWSSFQKSGSKPRIIRTDDKNDVPNTEDSAGDISGVCIFDSCNLYLHSNTGEQFVSPLPFQLKKVWKMKYGLLIERLVTPQEQATKSEGEILPIIFSLLHPLDEVSPVVTKSHSVTSALSSKLSYLCNQNQCIVYVSEDDPSIVLIYDYESGQHSAWRLRKALAGEYVNYILDNEASMIIGNSIVSTPSGMLGATTTSSLQSRFLMFGHLSPSTLLTSLSPFRSQLNSSRFNSPSTSNVHQSKNQSPSLHSFNNMAAISRSLSPAVAGASGVWRLSNMTPSPQSIHASPHMQHLHRSPWLSQSSEGGSFVTQSVNQLQEPLTPDICLDLIWIEPANQVSCVGMAGKARTIFMTKDFVGQHFLCYFLSDSNVLKCVRLEESNDRKQLIFGTITNIPAKNVTCVADLIVIQDFGLNLALYSGTTKLSNIHIPSPPLALLTTGFTSFSADYSSLSVLETPRRSSMIPSSRPTSAMGARFDEDVKHLSPVPTELNDSSRIGDSFCEDACLGLTGTVIGLRDGLNQHFTVETTSGNFYRLKLPASSSCVLVERCLKAVQCTLPRDLALQLYAKWYSTCNAPGATFTSVSQEWNMFVSCILGMMGYDTEKIPLLKKFNKDFNVSPAVHAKRFKAGNNGSDEDWKYLLESSHHGLFKECNNHLPWKIFIGYKSTSYDDQQSSSACKINSSAQLFQQIPAILYSLHLVYEDMKLNTLLWKENLLHLASFLLLLSCDLRIQLFQDLYCRDFPDLFMLLMDSSPSQIDEDQLKTMHYPPYLSHSPPNIFDWLHNGIAKKQSQPAFPYITDVNNVTRNIVMLYGMLMNQNMFKVSELLRLIIAPGQRATAVSDLSELAKFNATHNIYENVVNMMTMLGITKQDLRNLPSGVALPLYDAINQVRENPPSEWNSMTYSLIEREDLSYLYVDDKCESNCCDKNRPSNNYRCVTKKPNSIIDDETGMEYLDHEILSLRFNQDLRIQDVCRLLQSSKPVTITVQQRPEVSDHDFIEEQERQLYSLCIRTMALSVGRGMFTMRSSRPIITETLPVPKLCLSGKSLPRNTTVDLSHIDVPTKMNLWPLFHNGIAAGLKICASSAQIDSAWIVYNAPKNNNDTSVEHAGFLMALGLNGHLTNLARHNLHDYLAKGHELTSVGLLLGFSAAKRGTMDMTCTKLLSIHMEAFLPPTSVELNVPQVVQVSAVLGIGLVYEGTAHRHTAEVLLSEISRPPGPEGENCSDRESYSLASGLALGLVTFGRGSEMAGLSDLSMADTLHQCMIGGHRKMLNGANKDKFKSPSYQIKEGDVVNVDVTSPGATLALGMMFFNTGNRSIADWMVAPDTQIILDSVRPDFLLLRTLSRGLILWEDICPSTQWVESHLSDIMAKYAFKRTESDTEDIDYESMSQAYCNIIAGGCLALGLKFAGSANNEAFLTIMKYVKRFIQISLSSAVELAGKMTLETCLCTVVLAISMVMAGTGDLEVLRICRYLRSRIGQSSSCVLYGSHMATHMALGLLFLGGGRYTLSTSKSAVAAMICAFFPKFPIHSNDNRYHLQAFRHLYVLAAEPRLLIPREIDSKRPTYTHITVEFKDTKWFKNKKYRIKAPCILPQLELLHKVSVEDERFWPIVFEEGMNWECLKRLLSDDGSLFVKQKAGCLSYLEDPKGYKTLLAQGLRKDTNSIWNAKPSDIRNFSSDANVLNFAQNLLQPSFSSTNSQDGDILQILSSVLYECVTKEKMLLFSLCTSTLLAVKNLGKHQLTSLEIWQIKLMSAFVNHRLSACKTSNDDKCFMNPEFVYAIQNNCQLKLDHWFKENAAELKDYLFEKQSTILSPFLACYLIFYDIPVPYNLPQVNVSGQATFASMYVQLKSRRLPARTIMAIVGAMSPSR